MSAKRDYYEVIGVSKKASQNEIKSQYRKLALKFHPDRNKSPEAADHFKEISESYAVLSDPKKRQLYDQHGHAGVDGRYSTEDIFRGAGANFDDILSDLFGGRGGLGNTNFKSSTNRAPRKFTSGKIGEEYWIWLQLKTIADIGIIGLPNAGKSSLLAAITNATPKIANYKFTTINPNLGVATYDDKEITLADIPGLIEGAHTGVGLGIKFLKHIERCKALLHMIDITEKDLNYSYDQVKKEMANYSKDLLNKKEIIVLNKVDLLEKKKVNEIIKSFSKNKNCEVLVLSTLEKSSISKVKAELLKYVS